jgi:SET domain-containing protein
MCALGNSCRSSGLGFSRVGWFPMDMSLQTEMVYPKASSIHGQGLFARANIPLGSQIIEYVGERMTKRETLQQCQANNEYIFALDDETDLDGNIPWNLARLINHSCQPNSEARLIDERIWIVAIRDICADEEISFNYGYDLEFYREHPCHCGTSSCVGYMVAEEFFSSMPLKSIPQNS